LTNEDFRGFPFPDEKEGTFSSHFVKHIQLFANDATIGGAASLIANFDSQAI